MSEAWRDTASPGWVLSWGRGDETDWLERELGLKPGRYRLERGEGRLTFIEPHRGERKDLFLYELTVRDGEKPLTVVIGEITNGIWAQGYWRGPA